VVLELVRGLLEEGSESFIALLLGLANDPPIFQIPHLLRVLSLNPLQIMLGHVHEGEWKLSLSIISELLALLS
jgi:hypothetical protein